MKRFALILFSFITISILAGCQTSNSKWNDAFSNMGKIEVRTSDEEVLSTITTEDEIEEFIRNLSIEEWELEKVPTSVEQQATFTLYQKETIQLSKPKLERDLKETATFVTYKDTPFIDFYINGVKMSFKVSEQAYEYLQQY